MKKSAQLLAFAMLALALSPASFAIAQVQLEVEAFPGTPFGVGRLTLRSGGEFRINRPPRPGRGRIADLARRLAAQAGAPNPVDLQSSEMAILERDRRLFYPVFAKRERPILQQFISVPSESTAYFLFTGDAPLELTVHTPDATSTSVTPRVDPAGHARLLGDWWREYSSVAGGGSAPAGYPAMVEQYLVDTLARRMRLAVPQPPETKQLNLLRGELGLLAGTEAKRLEMARQILLSDLSAPATATLPEELPAPQPEFLTPPQEVPVEPLAARVPVECFYVRFGNFPNFLWLRHRTEDWGGELRDVVSERGLDYGLNARMQKVMGLREGKLAEVFGDKVIGDVALIGTDMFVNEGAAIGTLFQAKSSLALSNDLMQQRRATMRETPGATEEKLSIGGKAVSKITSPDGALRSFYVADGDFHLVTTSQQIVEWFIATADGKHPSLASSAAFRATRTRLPIARNDTVFVYLSPEFFDHLLSARSHVEMQRRLRSDVEMELISIAQLAAQSEGRPGSTIEELIASDMLPAGFGQRADGSRLELREGKLVDTLRGARGTFLPVPDMKVANVTPAEAAEYEEFRQYYVDTFGRMEPVALAIRREELPEGKLERVIVDALAAPLAPKHVAMLSNWLGEPTTRSLTGIAGDVVSFQAVLQGGGLLGGPPGEYLLFGALRNADPAIALSENTSILGRIVAMQLQGVQGYVGAWPHPGMLSLISTALTSAPDAAGFSRSPTGLWQRQLGDFTLLSFHPEILDGISPGLEFVEAERPAQVRIRAEDLANSTLAPLINAYGYKQSRAITAGNARFMNMLIEQLHVTPADAMSTGERLLGAKFISPLGGEYKLEALAGGPQAWVATALAANPAGSPPTDYQFRALNWLRGVEMELLLDKAPTPELSFHGEFIMPVEARAPAFELPKLPFAQPKPAPAKPAAKPPAEKLPTPAPKSLDRRILVSFEAQAQTPMRLISVFLLAAVIFSPSLASAADRFNVVLIMVDDMNNDLGCYGHPLVKSPNINRLAARGVRFDRAYCQYPVCNPSRVSLLSGLRPDTTQVYDLKTPPRTHLGENAVFLPQYFRQQGYHTAHVGKIFHTGDEFEDPSSWDVEVRETGKHPPAAAIVRSKEHNRPVKYGIEWAELNSPDEETADGVVARRSAAMLERLAADPKPFFLAVGFRRPHQPYAAPKKYFELYPPAKISALDEPAEHLRRIPALAFTYPVGTPQLAEADRQEIVAAYYASISFVDAQLGVVLDALDQYKLWDNTVVVFASDHGYHLGEHGGMWHKMSLFEQSARVPLVVIAPGAKGNGQACERTVELIDVYPTLVDLCNLPTIEKLEGHNLRPLLEDPEATWTPAAYTQVLRGEIQGRSVRTERWRYTEWDEGRHGIELYDHQADPRELRNLAGEADSLEVQAQLQKLLRDRGDNN